MESLKKNKQNFNESLTKNIDFREYQEKIAQACVNKNSLVVLPTGLGKTIIAVLVAKKTLNLFPKSYKVIVLAPTRPLINQHFDSFIHFLSLNPKNCAILTGRILPEKRAIIFQERQFLFFTPQTLRNDLVKNRYNLGKVCLIIFDEAHHASGDYAYCYIADKFSEQNPDGIILGLTASPGASKTKITRLCKNLHIPAENIHIRTRADEDVKRYLKPMNIYKIGVDLTDIMKQILDVIRLMLNERLNYLNQMGFLQAQHNKNYQTIYRKDLLRLNQELISLIKRDGDKTGVYGAISVNAQALILYHLIELIEQQGLDVLLKYLEKMNREARRESASKAIKILAGDFRLRKIFLELNKIKESAPKQLIHPKFKMLKKILKNEFSKKPDLRALIFVKLRDSVKLIVDRLKNIKSFKPARFVGQSNKSKQDKGLSQKKQLELLDKFREGIYNILVSTNVGEEGLDIAECDIVIFYDAVASEIRMIQRQGRTARHREGNVIILYCKNTSEEAYLNIALKKIKKMTVNLKNPKYLENVKQENTYKKRPAEKKESEKPHFSENAINKENIGKNINKKPSQLNLEYFNENLKKRDNDIENPRIIEVQISKNIPAKFGIRKWLENLKVKIKITEDIDAHIILFNKIAVKFYRASQLNEFILQKNYTTLKNKYKLVLFVIDYIDYAESIKNEKRLLKKKFYSFAHSRGIQIIQIDIPNEALFIIKSLYEQNKGDN
ncbi:MAG: DEAD/DEAH box helicase [Promethearchaeota archaeon]